jgi:salicylate hydroxylase
VLSKASGIIGRLAGWPIDTWAQYSVLPEDYGVIAECDVPKRIRDILGTGIYGIRRPVVIQALVEAAEAARVPIKWSHKLVSFEQFDEHVKLRFENGVEEIASFVVGCDGLHSNTRHCLFGKQPANFTGLTQVSVML